MQLKIGNIKSLTKGNLPTCSNKTFQFIVVMTPLLRLLSQIQPTDHTTFPLTQ
nr:MAG TPA: hypothetical protein [Caudoviricetes sp.]